MLDQMNDYREYLLERYAAMGDELAQALARIPPSEQHLPLSENGWSAHQIMAHLRDTEAHAYLPRLERILNENEPLLDHFDGTRWMEQHYRPDEPLAAILSDYLTLRERELSLLRVLPAAAWARTARHPGWGLRTLQWLVEHSLDYTQMHLKQLQEKA